MTDEDPEGGWGGTVPMPEMGAAGTHDLRPHMGDPTSGGPPTHWTARASVVEGGSGNNWLSQRLHNGPTFRWGAYVPWSLAMFVGLGLLAAWPLTLFDFDRNNWIEVAGITLIVGYIFGWQTHEGTQGVGGAVLNALALCGGTLLGRRYYERYHDLHALSAQFVLGLAAACVLAGFIARAVLYRREKRTSLPLRFS